MELWAEIKQSSKYRNQIEKDHLFQIRGFNTSDIQTRKKNEKQNIFTDHCCVTGGPGGRYFVSDLKIYAKVGDVLIPLDMPPKKDTLVMNKKTLRRDL